MITEVQQTTRTQTGTSKYTGTFGEKQLRHLLRRTMFGATQDDLTHYKNDSMTTVVDALLNVSTNAPSPPLNHYQARLNDPDIPLGSTWVNQVTYSNLGNVRRESLRAWWLGLMINQDRTILEKLTLFWHNHFSTEFNVVNSPYYLYNHHAAIRSNAMGNLKTFVKKMTVDPAMLVYLNGDRNTKTAPDENYARELQELFTLGKGDGSKYTEDDVQKAAKVLTGWRVNRATGETYFNPNIHDTGNKQFSSFYNNETITGQSGADGAKETDELLAMIFKQNEVAKFICRKIYRWFVYYDIDAGVEKDVIEPLATTFINNNYDIKPVLKELFESEHFFDQANFSCLIKSPIDFLVGFMRTTDIVFEATSIDQEYGLWNLTHQFGGILQQDVGTPPNVSGWPAYYQIPLFHEIWVNTTTLPYRNQITDVLTVSGYRSRSGKMYVDNLALADKFTNPSNPNLLISESLDLLHAYEVSQGQKDYMKTILLSGQLNDQYWTDAWNDYKADPTDTTKKGVVENRLKLLYKYIFNLAEYQLS
jgi:uncharacterized protein (DUF1800 family)